MERFKLSTILIVFALTNLTFAASYTGTLSGLIGYWQFDEDAGTTAYDSANSFDGTIHGTPSRVTGISGNALQFNGTTDYVDCGFSSAFKLMNDVSVSMWVKRSGLGLLMAIEGGPGETLQENAIFFLYSGYRTSKGNVLLYVHEYNSAVNQQYDFIPIPTGQWIHVAVVRNSTTRTVSAYFNGELVGTYHYSIQPENPLAELNLTIGSRSTGAQPFSGLIDEVALFNRALSQSTIRNIYEDGLKTQGFSDDLFGYWQFDEDAGTTAYDSANNFDGIIHGTPSRVEGISGKALQFNGTTTYVDCGFSSAFKLMNDVSLCMWVKRSGLLVGLLMAIEGGPGETLDENAIFFLQSGSRSSGDVLKYGHEHGSGVSRQHDFAPIPTGQWTHVAIVRDSTAKTVSAYFNGELVGIYNYSIQPENPSSELNLTIGSRSTGLVPFSGLLDEVALFNRALSQSTIQYIYENGLEIPIPPAEPTPHPDAPKVKMQQFPMNLTETSARLMGQIIDANDVFSEHRFRYWIEGHPAKTTPWVKDIGSGPYYFLATVDNLVPGRDYQCVAEARNSAGFAVSNQISFKTLGQAKLILSLSSSTGGSVSVPMEGEFVTGMNTTVQVTAVPNNNSVFEYWTGSAVDQGKVADSFSETTTVFMDADYTLKANFSSTLTSIYVDDSAIHDPGLYDKSVSDPDEDGTLDHPFDSIQEAIEVAQPNTTVLVNDGIYYETIDFMGKNIEVHSIDDNTFPVIDANYTGTVVTFDKGEGSDCRLSGFILTRGIGEPAGAVFCKESHPKISNCVIVGNRCFDPEGGIVLCDSSNSIFENCTIVDNYCSGAEGAGLVVKNANVFVYSSILWGNLPLQINNTAGSDPIVIQSNVQGGWFGIDIISEEPDFVQRGYWANPDNPNQVAGPQNPNTIWIDGNYHTPSDNLGAYQQ